MSSEKSSSSSSSGIGFFGLLTIVFITLKLLGVIDWSWWLVFIPVYVSIGLFIFWVIVAIIIAVLTD